MVESSFLVRSLRFFIVWAPKKGEHEAIHVKFAFLSIFTIHAEYSHNTCQLHLSQLAFLQQYCYDTIISILSVI